MSVTRSCLHLKDPIFDGQQGDIESTSSHVVDQHVALPRSFLIKPICDCCSSGLVDDPQHVQARNRTCILCGLPLGVIEISGNCDDSVVHFCTKIGFGCLLHLGEDHGRDLLCMKLLHLTHGIYLDHGLVASARRTFEGPKLDICLDNWVCKLATDKPLGIKDCVLWITCNLIFCCITNQTL